MKSFNVDRSQAEEFLNSFGFLESKLEGGVLKATSGALGKIFDGVKSAFKGFHDHHAEVKFDKVVLTGSTTALPGLPAHISDNLQLPVEIANPWMNIVYPAIDHEKLMSQSLRFAVAAGLVTFAVAIVLVLRTRATVVTA
jgi:Tfp pilus assembly PilM family ATPase